uniref:Box C/D snoRNA protein 1 n=1 Tax=Knipowitschia caucasica TaxID=637954 RepID=A0AAV2KRL3_KNICA
MDTQQETDCLEEEEVKGTKRKISLFICAVCGREEAKYTCPRCLTQSCSLLCVKKHKENTECSGVRDKTAFVGLAHFDEMNLLSDYRFLEDISRFSDGATRDSIIRVPQVTLKAKFLMSNARKMNINLRLLPCTFARSKENSTIFNRKEKLFMWHLKIIFPDSCADYTQRRVSDQLTLKQILDPYIHPTESDPVARQKLKMYVHEVLEHIKVFMKAEGRKANSVRYHELDFNKTLRDNLSYKTLIEYPVLHVVLKDHWKDYPLKGLEQSSKVSNSTLRLSPHKDDTSKSATGAGSLGITSPPAKRAKREGLEKEDGELTGSGDEDEDSSSSESSDASEGPTEERNVAMTVSKDMGENYVDHVVSKDQSAGSSERMKRSFIRPTVGTFPILDERRWERISNDSSACDGEGIGGYSIDQSEASSEKSHDLCGGSISEPLGDTRSAS